MSWLETKYVNLLSSRLSNFKRKSNNLWNFRCPICGDSTTNKNMARGYIYSSKGDLRFHCHKCSASMKFPYFIKALDPSMYYEYIKETLVENGVVNETTIFEEKMKPPVFVKGSPLKKLKKISALAIDHPAKLYVDKRLIPSELHYKLFYAPKFKEWVNSILPNKFGDSVPEEPRLVLPFLDADENLIGFQGRSFSKRDDRFRYITIMLDETKPRLFGVDRVSDTGNVYVLEGPIDSLFIENGIASAGGDVDRELSLTSFDKERIVILYDNEPRSSTMITKLEKAIRHGHRICLWPSYIEQKDVNDMVLNGYTPAQIKQIVDSNIYEGLEAKLALSLWKRC